MRRVACAAVVLLVCPMALAQMMHHGAATPFPEDKLRISPCAKYLYFAPAVRQPEFQKVYWPAIKSGSEDALLFFSQAMTQYYGLNYEEAMRNFKGAKKSDSTMAMASWGIALASGSNINLTMDDSCHLLAKQEIGCALSLAGEGPRKEGCEKRGDITRLEIELIKALNKRYDYPVGDEKAAETHAEEYRDAMADIWNNNQNDQNIGALYAESMMDVHPWDLYEKDGKPKPYTPPIVAVLKASLGNPPNAVGANHYYIHGIEGSTEPKEAEPSADLLQTRVVESGHLVHMSSHIYLLVGKYRKSLEANIKAVRNDVAQYGQVCSGPYEMYTRNSKCPQLYYGHYLSHDYFFGSVSATFTGQSEEAMKLACATRTHVRRFVIYEPGLQRYLTAPLMTMVVNRNWDKILKETETPYPNFNDCYLQPPFSKEAASGCHILRSIWYWARGMALAATGKDADAIDALLKMREEGKATTSHPPDSWGNNKATKVLTIGEWILNARVNWAKKDKDKTFSSLISAVEAEDDLSYDEPPQWFTPAREALGGAYLQARQYADALGIFEEALERHPASGRALYGKIRALREQAAELAGKDDQKARQKASEADNIKDEFCRAWYHADYKMTDADLWPAGPFGTGKSDDGVTCSSTEKKQAPAPSQCNCPLTNWPPPLNAADPDVDQLKCLK